MFEAELAAPKAGRCWRMARRGASPRTGLVVVSNDLNEDLPPRDAQVWHYLAFLQALHCDLAAEADRVIEVVAGRGIDWKGESA